LLRTPLRQLRVPDMTAFGSTVELRLNASGNCAAKRAIVSERNRGLRASETRRVARTIALSARHKRASGIPSRYAKARHLPCTLSWRGAYLPTHVREGCPAGRDLVSWANNTHLSPKVRRFTPHSWSNGPGEAASNSHLRQCSRSAAVTAPCCMEAAFHRSK
jgi:hypothetical protein